jgi:glycosyltransferase involved in cell wall biosynthesis
LELRKRDVRVSIARTYQGTCWDPLEAAGVTLLDHDRWDLAVRLTAEDRFNVRARQAIYLGELLTQHASHAVRYALWARKHGVTHVFANNSFSHSPATVAIAKLLRIPCWSYFQGNLGGHNGFRQLMPYVDFGFGVSKRVRDQAVTYGFSPDRLDVLYPGVVLPAASLAAPREKDGRIRVGMVGMFTRWKGHIPFLKAFALAAGRAPQLDAWLFGRVVPGQEAYGREVLQLIETLGLQDRVRIVDDRSSPETIYPDADFTVHCSTTPEPFGRVVIEAMSFGRPIVAASQGGPTEVVTPGEDGFLVDPLDAEGLAGYLVDMANDENKRVAMGEAARGRIERDFTYPNVLTPLFARLGLRSSE